MKYGFIKVAAAIPRLRVADTHYNVSQIMEQMTVADSHGVEIICFPELCITGYTCQDLFGQQILLDAALGELVRLLDFSQNLNIVSIVGLPFTHGSQLLNCAAVVHKGKLLGIVPKTFLPNCHEFYEKRWFASARDIAPAYMKVCGQCVPLSSSIVFETPSVSFGIEICEDLWAPVSPGTDLSLKGAEVLFNLSASNELAGKNRYVRGLIESRSAMTISGYVYAGSGMGESTQDLVFAGRAMIAENGTMLVEHERFALDSKMITAEIDVERIRAERRTSSSFATAYALTADKSLYATIEIEQKSYDEERLTLQREVSPLPFVPSGGELDERCREILLIQASGLTKRIAHTGAKSVVIGISGGLDSTLALLVCVYAFDMLGLDRKGIVGITMPGFGTTDRTYTNAIALMHNLGVSTREIDIREACLGHFRDIGHAPTRHDVTYENAQARERTQILMDVANQMGGLVVGTGDLSELALGWATYNGDHMSMYAVNSSIPKTLVRHLITWVADNHADEACRTTLLDVVQTPISPELLPTDDEGNMAQITEDLVGPYELHDFFLYYTLRFGFRPSKIFFLAQKAFADGGRGNHYTDEVIKKWLTVFFRRFFAQQFKRSCMPDGPKVGTCSLSPRGDWRMPSDAEATVWLDECEAL